MVNSLHNLWCTFCVLVILSKNKIQNIFGLWFCIMLFSWLCMVLFAKMILEQAQLTKEGRERAARIKLRRESHAQRKREKLKAAFLKKQVGFKHVLKILPMLLVCFIWAIGHPNIVYVHVVGETQKRGKSKKWQWWWGSILNPIPILLLKYMPHPWCSKTRYWRYQVLSMESSLPYSGKDFALQGKFHDASHIKQTGG